MCENIEYYNLKCNLIAPKVVFCIFAIMLHVKKILFLYFLFSLNNIWAQTSECNLTFKGKILDEHDRSPLDFASIQLKETGQGTICNENGEFNILEICPGSYTLIITHSTLR